MAAFEYRQALEIRDACARHRVKYLFIGKSGAILLGYPDTTQDAHLFVDRFTENGERLVQALRDLGFSLSAQEAVEIRRGKDFIQLKNGPFDLDLIFAPDGIERFDDAWNRRVDVEGFPVCDIDDIVSSKRAANRQKDKESLPRLISFRNWLKQR
jgi:hypothetical protein